MHDTYTHIYVYICILCFRFDEALELAGNKLKLSSPWETKQVEVLRKFIKAKDQIIILPTGYGKSAIFQALPFLSVELGQPTDIVIVVTPLNSITMNQCHDLQKQGISACYLSFSGVDGGRFSEDGEIVSDASLEVTLGDIYL